MIVKGGENALETTKKITGNNGKPMGNYERLSAQELEHNLLQEGG